MTRMRIVLVVMCAGCGVDLSTTSADVDLNAFVLPMLSGADRAAIVHRYDALDPTDAVPRGLLEDAIVYYDVNLALLAQPRYFAVVDFSRYSGKDRYWLVDTATGGVEAHKVAHGSGSDPNNDGIATLFSNVSGSYESSLGFYLTGEIYDGTHPHSMRLDGLSPDGSPNQMADSNVRDRLIVMHEASYVSDTNTSQQGRSNGCLALDPAIELDMVNRIHDGALIYAALSPLAPPVGRTPPSDPPTDDPGSGSGSGSDGSNAGDPAKSGGCAAGGSGGGFAIAFALLGLRRRRRLSSS